MADYSDLDPAALRASLSDGTRLKKSITTDLYTGGTPSAANQVKPSIMYADGTLKESVTYADGTLKPSWLIAGGGGGGDPISYARLSYTVASGTAADSITSGARRTRTINTVDVDGDSIVSIATNKFTLEPGTYHLLIGEAMENTSPGEYMSWVYDVTGAAYKNTSSLCFASANNSTNVHSVTVTPTVTTEYEIRAQSGGGNQGSVVTSGVDEKYMTVEIWKAA